VGTRLPDASPWDTTRLIHKSALPGRFGPLWMAWEWKRRTTASCLYFCGQL